MIPAFVINLDRRKDRFKQFINANVLYSDVFKFERIVAVDGSSLDLYGPLKNRINPWNFKHLNERTLRGVVGCALSHMHVWEKIGALHCEFAAVFEDDAVCIPSRTAAGRNFLRTLSKREAGVDLLWLNDYERFVGSRAKLLLDRTKSRVSTLLMKSPRLVPWGGETEITTEAYLITPKLAQEILSNYYCSVGAIDEIMRDFVSRKQCKSIRMRPSIFRQRDRSDSDIR